MFSIKEYQYATYTAINMLSNRFIRISHDVLFLDFAQFLKIGRMEKTSRGISTIYSDTLQFNHLSTIGGRKNVYEKCQLSVVINPH